MPTGWGSKVAVSGSSGGGAQLHQEILRGGKGVTVKISKTLLN